jgi:hypothetical protein
MAPYVLGPDEALVTQRWPSPLRNVSLWNRHLQTYDYAPTVSLNWAQTVVDGDGNFM